METASLKAFAPIPADPYPWPFDGGFSPADTALVVIDMQTDFCGIGGYVDRMGYDLSMTRAPIAPIARLIAAARACGMPVIHTREGHRPDLSDLPANKRWRSKSTSNSSMAPILGSNTTLAHLPRCHSLYWTGWLISWSLLLSRLDPRLTGRVACEVCIQVAIGPVPNDCVRFSRCQ